MTTTDKHQLGPLLERAAAGDTQAWDAFFRQLRPYLHALVLRALGPEQRGPLDFSDIVQSCLRRVWEHFPQAHEDLAVSRLLGWIEAIVRNRCCDAVRRALRDPARPAGPAPSDIPERLPPDQAVQRDRQAARLAAALGRLSEREHQAVVLYWFERLPDAVIGERLGGSPGAVRVLRFRALKKLRRLMEAGRDDEC
jgi:RNA polymerase sigma-70 factor (ECF subfamily)